VREGLTISRKRRGHHVSVQEITAIVGCIVLILIKGLAWCFRHRLLVLASQLVFLLSILTQPDLAKANLVVTYWVLPQETVGNPGVTHSGGMV
jgi:hypothetical protein